MPSRGRSLDLADLELKSRCRLCGAALSESKSAPDKHRRIGRAAPDSRPRGAALTFVTIVAFALTLGSAALVAHKAWGRTAASVTVKLPPARPASPRPAFSFDQ